MADLPPLYLAVRVNSRVIGVLTEVSGEDDLWPDEWVSKKLREHTVSMSEHIDRVKSGEPIFYRDPDGGKKVEIPLSSVHLDQFNPDPADFRSEGGYDDNEIRVRWRPVAERVPVDVACVDAIGAELEDPDRKPTLGAWLEDWVEKIAYEASRKLQAKKGEKGEDVKDSKRERPSELKKKAEREAEAERKRIEELHAKTMKDELEARGVNTDPPASKTKA